MDRNKHHGLELVELRLKALFLAALDGDAKAYQAFLHALGQHVRAFLRRRLDRWPDDVEDVVQEVLIAVHNGRHTYAVDQPLTAWAYAIARYKMIDHLRSRSAYEKTHLPLDDQAEMFSGSDEETTHARRDIMVLLEQLPDRQRLPIVHVKLHGLSVAETVALTGLSESAVKVGIHRGLKALAKKIQGILDENRRPHLAAGE
ncbi:sigma-70 family RNA polymerase sigma factor [Achromobacter aloeverae]